MAGDEEWVLRETKTLIERGGLEPYVAAPLVEASDRWFPDEWHADDAGVARLAKRVFAHAGLADVEITTELGELDCAVEAAEVDATKVHLVVDPQHLGDPLTLIAGLARMAGGVFLARHDLGTDGKLVDLATIYLGFGILTTNAAYRYRASGEQQGYTAITRWSHDQQGELSAATMAHALAMQLTARDATSSEVRDVVRQLEPNQRGFFEEAYGELEPDAVASALGLPSRSTWPPKRPLPEPPARSFSLWAKKPELPAAQVKSGAAGGTNRGRAVLRVTENRKVDGGFVALFVSMVPGIALAVHGYGVLALLAMIATCVGGVVLGARIRRDVCSDGGCRAKLPANAASCPGCGGHIAGKVLPGENKLEAEERLQLNQGDYDLDVGDVHVDVHPGRDRMPGSVLLGDE